jgi:hypothetical protein
MWPRKPQNSCHRERTKRKEQLRITVVFAFFAAIFLPQRTHGAQRIRRCCTCYLFDLIPQGGW